MKPKYYFRDLDSEFCYELDYHIDDAKEEGLSEIELYIAMPEKVKGFRWCKAVSDIAEDEYCGGQCEEYEPRNGKSGICKHHGMLYEPGEKVIFKINSNE